MIEEWKLKNDENYSEVITRKLLHKRPFSKGNPELQNFNTGIFASTTAGKNTLISTARTYAINKNMDMLNTARWYVKNRGSGRR